MRNYSNLPMKTSVFKRKLRKRIRKTYWQGNSTMSVDELVACLQRKYRDYRRLKLRPFTTNVKQNLESSQNNIIINRNGKRILNIDDDDDDDDMTSHTAVSKKSKENDSQMLETDDLMSESEENISAVTKKGDDDEVYSVQFKPEFDLTKSMLRDKYNPKTDIEKPKNVEVEVVANSSNKKMKNVDLVEEDTGVKTSAIMKERKLNDDEHDKIMFNDLGGIDGLLDELIMQVIVPLYHPNLHRRLGVKPISGILLHGPPGCGKTSLALAIANETGIPFYMISATELVSGVSGASEESIRELFSKAYRTAPSIVFIDEIDAIASKRENQQREMERRIVTQLMTCMDESHRPDGKQGYVLVIGATNRPDAIDPALRRPGRFDREFLLGVPDENARTKILSALTRKVELEGAFDLVKISRATTGFVGADLYDLVNTAGNVAIRRIVNVRKSEISKENTDTERILDWLRKEWTFEEMEKHSITMSDFEVAAKLVQPSLRREGFSSIPSVKWEDVGGLDELRREFYRHIVRRIKYPDASEEGSRVKRETGFLLYGPPGCGKTFIAKAVANEAGANFIHIKGPELLSKYVGESELAMRTLFSRARMCAPCVLFFDEVDALTTKRGKEGGWVVERLLNQLLIELDGADERKGVYVIGATNRPEVMDPAVLRSGRFGKRLYVPLPTPDERGLILKALARTMQLDADVDLIAIGKSDACDNFSGADLSALINEAVTVAEDEEFSKTEPANPAANEGTSMSSSDSSLRDMRLVIKAVHFDQVLGSISPSVSDKQIQFYNGLQKIFNPKRRT